MEQDIQSALYLSKNTLYLEALLDNCRSYVAACLPIGDPEYVIQRIVSGTCIQSEVCVDTYADAKATGQSFNKTGCAIEALEIGAWIASLVHAI